MVRKLSKAALRKKRQAIARRNFGLTMKTKKSKRRQVRNVARRKRRYSRRGAGNSSKKMLALGLGAGVYGAVRDVISNALAPVTSKIPLGTIGDELALAVLGYQVNKRTKGILADVGKAGFIVEMSRIGVAVTDGSAFSTTSSTSNNATEFSSFS